MTKVFSHGIGVILKLFIKIAKPMRISRTSSGQEYVGIKKTGGKRGLRAELIYNKAKCVLFSITHKLELND